MTFKHFTEANQAKATNIEIIQRMQAHNTNWACSDNAYYIKCTIGSKQCYFYFIWADHTCISKGEFDKIYTVVEINEQGDIVDTDTNDQTREWVIKVFPDYDISNILPKKHQKEFRFTKKFSSATYGEICYLGYQKHYYILMEKKLKQDLFDHVADQNSEIMQARFDQKIWLFCLLLRHAKLMHNYTNNMRPFSHCDIKPENTRVTTDGNGNVLDAAFIDFGISKNLRDTVAPKQCKKIGGSPAYLPYETYTTMSCGSKSDVYSLGLIFCQILTGEPQFPHTMNGWMLNNSGIPSEWSWAWLEEHHGIVAKTHRPEIKFNCHRPELQTVVKNFLWRMLDLDYDKRPHTNNALEFFTTAYNCCTQPDNDGNFTINLAKLEMICADLWNDFNTLSSPPEGVQEAIVFMGCNKLDLLRESCSALTIANYCSTDNKTVLVEQTLKTLNLDFMNRNLSKIQTALPDFLTLYQGIFPTGCHIPNSAFARQFSCKAKHKNYSSNPQILDCKLETPTPPLPRAKLNNDDAVNAIPFVDNWVIYAYKNGIIAMRDKISNHTKWQHQLQDENSVPAEFKNLQFLLLPDDQLLCAYIDKHSQFAGTILDCNNGNQLDSFSLNPENRLEIYEENNCHIFYITKTTMGNPLTTIHFIHETAESWENNLPQPKLQPMVRLPSSDGEVLSVSWSDKFIYIIDCERTAILNKIKIDKTSEVILLRNGDFICKSSKHMLLCKFESKTTNNQNPAQQSLMTIL